MVHPLSHRVPRVRRYSGFSFAAFLFRIRDFHSFLLTFPCHSARFLLRLLAVLTPSVFLLLVWPLPLSLATTHRISVDFFSSPYLDVSVQAVPLVKLFIHLTMHALLTCGLLHSDILGSFRACQSPRLFAAYRVLLRLLMPRHPPCALISLNANFAELCLDFLRISS